MTTYNQTSLIRTPNGQSFVSMLNWEWYKVLRILSARELILSTTVNFLYSRQCRDLELTSSLARVRRSWSLFQSNISNIVLQDI